MKSGLRKLWWFGGAICSLAFLYVLAYIILSLTGRYGPIADASLIYAQRAHPDDSEIELNFWTSTQFDTTNVVGFKVVFEHGRAVSITRIHNKEEDARLSQAAATRIAQEAAVKHGYRLKDYRKATANYALLRDGAWMAFFECKAPTPDKNFTVWIDDRTGEARVESRE
jgi:hypothetical protein